MNPNPTAGLAAQLLSQTLQPLSLGADAARDTTGAVAAWRLSVTAGSAARVVFRPPAMLIRLVQDAGLEHAGQESTGFGLAWLPRFRDAALRAANELATNAEAFSPRTPLILWPKAGDPLGDVPSVLTFLRSASPIWSFMLDPLGLLTPPMVPFADDHFDRMFDSLATHPACWGVLLPSETDSPASKALLHRWNQRTNPHLRAITLA